MIVVSDTGQGIPKEIEGRLFQSFVTAGKQGGTGLGLAIVKKIVDEHGGSIETRSSNRGTTFVIRLPQPEKKPEKDGKPERNGTRNGDVARGSSAKSTP